MKSLQRGSIFALCFGLRFGERESGAQAQRRRNEAERNDRRRTAGGSTPIFG